MNLEADLSSLGRGQRDEGTNHRSGGAMRVECKVDRPYWISEIPRAHRRPPLRFGRHHRMRRGIEKERIEEERRLLYVAMTRARNELDLVVPLKFYVTHQARSGDAHVYGARSRFLNSGVMAALEAVVWPPGGEEEAPVAKALPRVDVGARLRGAWT